MSAVVAEDGASARPARARSAKARSARPRSIDRLGTNGVWRVSEPSDAGRSGNPNPTHPVRAEPVEALSPHPQPLDGDRTPNGAGHRPLPSTSASAVPLPSPPASLFDAAWGVFRRDLSVALRRRSDVAGALFFFVIVASLFPLGIGAEPALLRTLAPGVVWVAALLASMLSLVRLFADDAADGCLEQLLLGATPLPLLVLAKMAAHWASSGLLLALASPLLALQFGLSGAATVALAAALLVGTPVLSLVGGIGAALTVNVRGGGLLLALLVLPLVVPVLIFGAGAVTAVDAGQDAEAYFSLLGALLAGALFLAPLAASSALRIAME